MVDIGEDDILYLDTYDVIAIHQDIVAEDDKTERGLFNVGDADFVISYVKDGFYGECPSGVHEKATHLMRLLAANHCFVDGNKRTALASTWTFYFFNGYFFDYGEEIKAILKLYAVMQEMVDTEQVEVYFSRIAKPIDEAETISDETLEFYRLSRLAIEQNTSLTAKYQKIETVQDLLYTAEEARRLMKTFGEMVELISNKQFDDMPIDPYPPIEEVETLNRIVDELQLMIAQFEED